MTNKSVFSTEDLEIEVETYEDGKDKHIKGCEKECKSGYDYCYELRNIHLMQEIARATKKERTRLKAEVEKVIDDVCKNENKKLERDLRGITDPTNMQIATNNFAVEVKKRLGIK